MERRSVKTIAEVLAKALRLSNLKPKLDEQAAGPLWAQSVGPRIARNAAPQWLRGGTLFVHVRSAAWMTELSMLSDEIRLRLNRTLGKNKVREIRFAVGAVAAGQPPIPPTTAMPTAEDRAIVTQQTASIRDLDLREQVERTMLRARVARRHRN